MQTPMEQKLFDWIPDVPAAAIMFACMGVCGYVVAKMLYVLLTYFILFVAMI